MSTLNQREYYKIFAGPDQNKGFENIFLGYEAKVSEQTLLKDNITTFHYPYFASAVPIEMAGLVEDGATAGAIPAVADRLYTVQKGYGEVSPWGDSQYKQTGELYYTWLYSKSGESPVWIDRFYNPGSVSSENSLIGDYVTLTYNICSDDNFYDKISTRVFEPGVMYKYHHIGELYAQEHVATLSGSLSASRLMLHINDWLLESTDSSGYGNVMQIDGPMSGPNVISVNSEEADRMYIDFNIKDFIQIKVLHSDVYNCEKEFSLACWIKSDDWSNVCTSQIVGNMFNGGYQLSYNNFNFTPYIFIASTTVTQTSSYGCVFCFNQNFRNYNTFDYYKDYNAFVKTYIIDGNKDLVLIDTLNRVQKFDHLGNSKRHYINLQTEAYSIVADQDNTYYVATSSGVIHLDNELLTATQFTTLQETQSSKLLFDFNGNLKVERGATHVMYDVNNNIFTVKQNKLYKNNIDLGLVDVDAFTIDPDGYLWVVHISNGRNYISKISVSNTTVQILNTMSVGTGHNNNTNNYKQISIVYNHNRLKLSVKWYVVYVSNSDKVVYFITQDFIITNNVNLLQQTGSLDQFESNNLNVCTSDDFTGYQWLRTNKVVKYNNTPQITFKMSMRNVQTYAYKTFEVDVPSTQLKNYQWHHICVTFKDNKITFYIDTLERASLQIPYSYFTDYNNCNALWIGTYSGNIDSLNKELKIPDLTYNGSLDDVRIYNYALEPSMLVLFNRSYFKAKDMLWNIPTSPIQYVEGIERFFQHKIPGSKSQFYKIKIEGLDLKNVSDEQRTTIQKTIETYIYNAVDEVQPSYTELFDIEWG